MERQKHLHPHDGNLATPQAPERKTIMIDAIYLKAHRSASNLRVEKMVPDRLIGRTRGGMSTKLNAVTDANGLPISFFTTAGQVSDYSDAAVLLDSWPERNGCSLIAVPMPTGPEMPCKKKASPLGSRAQKDGTRASNMASAAINTAAASRSCSVD